MDWSSGFIKKINREATSTFIVLRTAILLKCVLCHGIKRNCSKGIPFLSASSGILKMTMVIIRQENRYGAIRTTPHPNYSYWSSDGFLPQEELIRVLLAQGAHQQDIGDLLDELDRDPKKFCVVM